MFEMLSASRGCLKCRSLPSTSAKSVGMGNLDGKIVKRWYLTRCSAGVKKFFPQCTVNVARAHLGRQMGPPRLINPVLRRDCYEDLETYLYEINRNGILRPGWNFVHSPCFFCGSGFSEEDKSVSKKPLRIACSDMQYFCLDCHKKGDSVSAMHGNSDSAMHGDSDSSMHGDSDSSMHGDSDFAMHLKSAISNWHKGIHPESPINNSFSTENLQNDHEWSEAKELSENTKELFRKARDNLGFKPLMGSHFKLYGLRLTADNALVFPYFLPSGSGEGFILSGIKTTRKVINDVVESSSGNNDKECKGMFGLNVVAAIKSKVIAITETEYDAMLCYTTTNIPSICFALDKGDDNAKFKVPIEVSAYLDGFEKIYLWFPLSSIDKAETLAEVLGKTRCFFVASPNSKCTQSPGEMITALQTANRERTALECYEAAIKRAKCAVRTPSNVITFCDLKDLVAEELKNADAYRGMKWKRFPVLNDILKGFRTGEMSIITGPTGSGKTTFLSEYSLDLCEQGVSTLWGSFEIPNQRHAVTLIKQLARDPRLEDDFDDHKYRRWCKKLCEYPMYWMDFHGTTDFDKVKHAIEEAVDPNGNNVQHVIIDNLQFMMGASFKDNMDRFVLQDQIVSKLRQLTTNLNIHLTLVAHPRKPAANSDGRLDAHSIFGSVRTTQEADNIFIVQQKAESGENTYRRYFEVVKNRYDGTLQVGDGLLMQFKKNTKCYELVYKSKLEKEEEDKFRENDENGNNYDDYYEN